MGSAQGEDTLRDELEVRTSPSTLSPVLLMVLVQESVACNSGAATGGEKTQYEEKEKP